ncbi:hypothetical protein Daudx_1334 [Candidatus Desulforudis audaxviator]|nr:hypothetical protein Daudx_1334 [Candidatus Desulforudis audaxviator]
MFAEFIPLAGIQKVVVLVAEPVEETTRSRLGAGKLRPESNYTVF